MARIIDGVEFNGNANKKVKKGQKNKVHIKGSGLELGTKTLAVNKMKSLMDSGTTVHWTVDQASITVDSMGKHIKFDSSLPSFLSKSATASKPKGGTNGDTGDIIITLEYSEEPDLLAECKDVEHEP